MNGNLKKLLHHSEEAVSFGLSAICKRLGASVLMRVKAQDVFRLEGSNVSEDLAQFVSRATFDFLAVDTERNPLFVVQFDGTSHPTDVASIKQQQENEICRKLLLPLVRVHAFHLSKKHHSIEIVGLLLETWFASKGMMPERSERSASFRTQDLFGTQGPGSVAVPSGPTSMPVSAAMSSSSGPASTAMPELEHGSLATGDVRKHIRRIYESGKCKSPVPSSVVGVDAAGNYHSVGFIRITDEAVASSKVALRNQLFPATTANLIEEALIHELYQELLDVIRGRGRLVSRAELGATIAAFRMRFKVKANPTPMG